MLFEGLRSAMVALRANTLRSLLTTLGIIIGVASVIIVVAIGEGARRDLEARIASLGTNILQLRPGSKRVKGRSVGADARLPFSESDVDDIRRNAPDVAAISGHLRRGGTVVFGRNNWLTNIDGVHADYVTVLDWGLENGRMFSEGEYRRGSSVAVIGATPSHELFGDVDPVGARVRIQGSSYEIIGLLDRKGSSPSGKDLDDVILIPLSATRQRLIKRHKLVPQQVGYVSVKVSEGADLKTVRKDVERLLRIRRGIKTKYGDNFHVRDLTAYVRAKRATQNTLAILLGVTAVISLIVGGIGIMNIMLVSVSERTREIGLRMAIGARRKDIRFQFLIEAVLLCLIGGLVGTALGIAGTIAIAVKASWPVFITPSVILLAVLASALVGVVFGFLPAQRAAQLNPIDALRAE